MRTRQTLRAGLLATIAAILIAVAIVMACGPAASPMQGATPTKTPTPTAQNNTRAETTLPAKVTSSLAGDFAIHDETLALYPNDTSTSWKTWEFVVTTNGGSTNQQVVNVIRNEFGTNPVIATMSFKVNVTMDAKQFQSITDELDAIDGVISIDGERVKALHLPAPTLAGTPPMIYGRGPDGPLYAGLRDVRPPQPTGKLDRPTEDLLNEYEQDGIDHAITLIIVVAATEDKAWVVSRVVAEGGYLSSEDEDSVAVAITLRGLSELIDEFEADDRIKDMYQPDGFDLADLGEEPTSRKHSDQQTVGTSAAPGWHEAGFTGAGVKVGVIDSGFSGLRSGIPADAAARITPNCEPRNLLDQVLTIVFPSREISACENFRMSMGTTPSTHGTQAVQLLLETAPQVNLHINTVRDYEGAREAAEWMTEPEHGQSVHVINTSLTARHWDGPGDGTGIDGFPSRHSIIATAKAAVETGTVWTTAAGNNGEAQWFSRNPAFSMQNRLEMQQPSVADSTCLRWTITQGAGRSVQVRWSDNWPTTETAAGRGTILALQLWGRNGRIASDTDDTHMRRSVPNRHPASRLTFTVPASGVYCLRLVKESGPTPAWIQIIAKHGSFDSVSTNTLQAGIGSPAESNEPGVIAVGGTEANLTTRWPRSSTGPMPEPVTNARVKPDVMQDATQPSGTSGTSRSAPRVAGLAALAIQALGHLENYDEPHEIADFLRRHADPQGLILPNDQWGYGLATLPSIEVPQNIQVSHVPCGILGNLKISWDDVGRTIPQGSMETRGYQISYQGTLHGGVTRGGGTNQHSTVWIQVPEGDEYSADVLTYIGDRYSRPLVYGAKSARTAVTLVPREVCPPRQFDAIPGDGVITLRWNRENDATSYEIQDGDDNTTNVGNVQSHLAVGLTNGTSYRFRVRAVGDLGTSDWSPWRETAPNAARANPATPIFVMEDLPRPTEPYDAAVLKWHTGYNDARYEIRIYDDTRSKWIRPPFRPMGWSQRIQVTYHYEDIQARALITQAVPGTQYAVEIRSRNGTNHSKFTEPVIITTPGTRPSDAPGSNSLPPERMPPSGLTATVGNPSVSLNWTAHSHPNYTTQQVWRRVAGVTPIEWTEIPIGLNDTSYTDSSITTSGSYVYRIRAEKDNGKGGISNAVTVDVTVSE